LSLGDAGAYPHVLGWKGAVLLRQWQRRLFAALSTDPATREKAGRLRQVTRRLAALAGSASPSVEKVEGLMREQERLQAGLAGEAREGLRAAPPSPRA